MNRTVFVGDLSFFVNEIHLMQHMSTMGKVASVQILKGSCGESLLHGFVKFENDQSATRAVKTLHNTKFMGRRLIVNSTNTKAPKKPYHQWHKFTLHFSTDHVMDVTEDMLESICEPFGEIGDCVVRSHVPLNAPEVGIAGYAVVFYLDAHAAQRAHEYLNKNTINHITFTSSFATQPQPMNAPSRRSQNPNAQNNNKPGSNARIQIYNNNNNNNNNINNTYMSSSRPALSTPINSFSRETSSSFLNNNQNNLNKNNYYISEQRQTYIDAPEHLFSHLQPQMYSSNNNSSSNNNNLFHTHSSVLFQEPIVPVVRRNSSSSSPLTETASMLEWMNQQNHHHHHSQHNIHDNSNMFSHGHNPTTFNKNDFTSHNSSLSCLPEELTLPVSLSFMLDNDDITSNDTLNNAHRSLSNNSNHSDLFGFLTKENKQSNTTHYMNNSNYGGSSSVSSNDSFSNNNSMDHHMFDDNHYHNNNGNNNHKQSFYQDLLFSDNKQVLGH